MAEVMNSSTIGIATKPGDKFHQKRMSVMALNIEIKEKKYDSNGEPIDPYDDEEDSDPGVYDKEVVFNSHLLEEENLDK